MDRRSVEDLAPPRPSRVDALLTRLGVVGVPARDAVLAAVVAVLTLVTLALTLDELAALEGIVVQHPSAVVALCTVQAAAIALRRTRPLLALGVVVALQVALVAAAPADFSVRGLAPLVVGYTLGTLMPVRRALAVTGAAAVLEAAAAVAVAPAGSPSLPQLALLGLATAAISYPGAALVGVWTATRRRYLDLVRLRAAEAVRAQHDAARAAVVAERGRMARELHDVAAHHLSGMVVQAAAVERLVDQDPDAARAGAAWIRSQGKETLDNLRQVVGLLREGDDGTAPVPGTADLDGLVTDARTLGDDVVLRRSGPAPQLGPLADAALYRVTQEALANARQHAPGAPVRVGLSTGGTDVVLEVVNDPSPAPPTDDGRNRTGAGLVGMRERATLVGGTLDAGPTPAGGWAVRLTVPQTRSTPPDAVDDEDEDEEGRQ
ncbi:two-component sensor histidine kinase [Xylanimonas oleitrophica]|uniref:histidine kinase n=1 Tax=Xylanimonas oleitrophica TaxID=2607479 RepID=A0A2W5XTJ6_9MICO|nr:histidine kinase [Xylanimonas oleitrophica]PZR53408.1 two-component sensor histidine kinase [Xylanimonas oleitrophica]